MRIKGRGATATSEHTDEGKQRGREGAERSGRKGRGREKEGRGGERERR